MAAIAVGAALWAPEISIASLSTAIVGGFGFGKVLVAGLAIWWRNRRRRQLMDMRDSALW